MKKALIIMFALVLGTCSRPPTTLEEVLKSGQLRVITRNSPTTYYEGAQGLDGPEFQLAHGFANFLSQKYDRDINVEFIPVERFNDLLPILEHGGAHLAAAGLTVTEERSQRVTFGPTYQTVKQHLVYRLNTGKPRSIGELRGKDLAVMAGSSHSDTLHELRYLEPQLHWDEKADAEISELLVAVHNQDIDYTVADTTAFQVHRRYMPDLRIAMDLTEEDKLAWAFGMYRTHSIQAEAEKYFGTLKNSGELAQVLDRFYGHTDKFDYVGTRTFIRDYDARFANYRDVFEAAATDTGIDWRLLAAIGYQESHWDPQAVSPTGVRGMMMLTKITANTMGVANRTDPLEAIPAGAQYFARLHKRLKSVPEPDKTWFALAAYNVGIGHLRDARKLTRQHGGDPNRWIDVKEHLPKLAIRKYYSQTKHGYARGWEPVKYVDNVRTYYDILNWLTREEEPEPVTEVRSAALPDFLRWL